MRSLKYRRIFCVARRYGYGPLFFPVAAAITNTPKPPMPETTVFVQGKTLAVRLDECPVEEFDEGKLMPVMRYTIDGAKKLRDLIDKGIALLEKEQ